MASILLRTAAPTNEAISCENIIKLPLWEVNTKSHVLGEMYLLMVRLVRPKLANVLWMRVGPDDF